MHLNHPRLSKAKEKEAKETTWQKLEIVIVNQPFLPLYSDARNEVLKYLMHVHYLL